MNPHEQVSQPKLGTRHVFDAENVRQYKLRFDDGFHSCWLARLPSPTEVAGKGPTEGTFSTCELPRSKALHASAIAEFSAIQRIA
jgi:hypothetical protein